MRYSEVKPFTRGTKNNQPLRANFLSRKKNSYFYPGLFLLFAGFLVLGFFVLPRYYQADAYVKGENNASKALMASSTPIVPVLDKVAYDRKMLQLANYGTSTPISTTTERLWPTKTPYPNAGAILPFKRIVAYYGNLYSTRMGVLGQYPKDQMLAKLATEVKRWEAADPTTPVQPALHYIAMTAQEAPGFDGKYRARMPGEQINKVIDMAAEAKAIVFIDIQLGLSNLQTELPLLVPYLKLPQVHLGIDPEFVMHNGARPGTVIGSLDAAEINYAANFLAKIVRDNNLPPKILVIHRFTGPMVTNYKEIKPLPEVQVVIDMDGWGSPIRKIGTYQAFVANKPVQFTGFKLFYKNDLMKGQSRLMTPAEVLKLRPQPIYIQYQ